jgi:hypothetical protein
MPVSSQKKRITSTSDASTVEPHFSLIVYTFWGNGYVSVLGGTI